MSSSRAEIEAAIPHRPPFLFLDRIVERTDDGLDAEWRVPPDADWLRGHYPGQPVTPGCLICEHVFQASAAHIAHRLACLEARDGVPILTKIENARFRRMVRPGEVLSTRVRVRARVGPAWYMTAKVACGGETVLRIDYTLSASTALERAAP